jgi:hypothetical protein
LTEKIVVCCFKLKIVSIDVIIAIRDSLRFGISCRDPQSLISLKEQHHITRTQISILISKFSRNEEEDALY